MPSNRWIVPLVTALGVAVIVAVVFFAALLVLGDVPGDAERSVVVRSTVAALAAAAVAFGVRNRIHEFADRRVLGRGHRPDEALKTFAGRMSRAVPMDELLLQLVESLRRSMGVDSAEVWTGVNASLDLVASVPHRAAARLTLAGEAPVLVSRTSVAGNAWLQVWLPELVQGRADRLLRVAPIAHRGELLGLIVVERTAGGRSFTEHEDRTLVELGRQVGLALHNVRLDSALQASLQELEVRNAELQASRARIVLTADESRRRIERDLHDGVQQHLVAVAVKLRVARDLAPDDPAAAGKLLDEVRDDVDVTMTELRELAHGIYPPLLRERGLPQALRAAAKRSPLPTAVDVEGLGRYPTEVETAVYFCCLEALQNASKHAGEGASIEIKVAEDAGRLVLSVIDDGVGFDPTGPNGDGLVNMRDRLGALGGELAVTSSVGGGTSVRGAVPTARGRGAPAG